MSIIEQIKAEIEKLKSNMDDRDSLAPNQKAGYLFAIADILSFLSTLKSEKPVPNDLKEAAEKYADETYYAYPPEFLDFVKEEIRDAFNAGAKWDREQMLKKHIPKEHSELTELEYAFYDLLASNNITNHSDEEVVKTAKVTATDLMDIAKAEMMKEAVECELVCIKDHLAAILPMKEFQWTVGDKVNIIIVKEDISHNNC